MFVHRWRSVRYLIYYYTASWPHLESEQTCIKESGTAQLIRGNYGNEEIIYVEPLKYSEIFSQNKNWEKKKLDVKVYMISRLLQKDSVSIPNLFFKGHSHPSWWPLNSATSNLLWSKRPLILRLFSLALPEGGVPAYWHSGSLPGMSSLTCSNTFLMIWCWLKRFWSLIPCSVFYCCGFGNTRQDQ